MKERKPETAEKEYMMLREEVMFYLKQRDSMAQFAYTMTVAVFAAAFAIESCWVVLCAIPFLLILSVRAAEASNQMAYVASYMIAVLEKDLDFEWETYHYTYGNDVRFQNNKIHYLLNYISRLDFALLSLASSALFWYIRDLNFCVSGSLMLGILILAAQLAIVVFELHLGIRFADFPKLKMDMIDNWAEVEKIIAQKQKNQTKNSSLV